MKPGEYFLETAPIEANVGRKTAKVVVRHTGDRPVQVGSHYHFYEVNDALDFQREELHAVLEIWNWLSTEVGRMTRRMAGVTYSPCTTSEMKMPAARPFSPS